MNKINVGYSYTLTGDLDIELKDFEEFCTSSSIETFLEGKVNMDSLREYLLEKN